jgi:sensor c-di-GMP phosphodiesterase-like protein
MNRAISGALLVILSAIAVATPVAISIKLAEWQGQEAEMAQQRSIAAGLTRRIETTNKQITAALTQLHESPSAAPCSDKNIALMQSLSLSATHLKGLAYVTDNNEVVCSSFGREERGFSIGKPDFVTAKGAKVWRAVPLPFSADHRFFVMAYKGYAAISHQELAIDVTAKDEDVYLGIISLPSMITFASHGPLKPEWLKRYKGESSLTFSDGEFLVAIEGSKKSPIATLSAIPIRYADTFINKFLLMFVPAGVALGLALGFVVILLAKRHMSLKSQIQAALRKREFFLLYQPVVDLRSGRCVGAEALLRWRRVGRNPIGPDVFIPVAEQTGLIRRITAQVLTMVGRDVPVVIAAHPDFHIGVNLSYIDLQAEETMQGVMDMVRSSGIAPHNIIVEATERGLLNEDITRDIVRSYRDNGLGVAIDDFGTGYSSLSYLTNFDLDYLKIDKSFVDTLGTDAATSQVALHIIEMSKSLKLDMIAEGVETEEQAKILRERGVQYAQGWLFAKPMPIAELMRFIESTNSPNNAAHPRNQLSLLDPLDRVLA